MGIAVLVWGMIQTVALAQTEPSARELPRWRGFNLLEMFMKTSSPGPFKEQDFRLISEWGFNFVRLPMDYRIWIQDDDWTRFNETALGWVDQAVEYGQKYGVHVCLNFHRAPGYTVASPPEPTSLWTDPVAQQVCARHWAHFAWRTRSATG
jgi:aryl-phospho-beta-D-glucosidase BglC (GH1 family)